MDLHRHAATIALLVVAAPFVLAPGKHAAPAPRAPVIDNSEHARTIEAMRPPKRARPVIAILALNAATEVMDLLVPFGVLQVSAPIYCTWLDGGRLLSLMLGRWGKDGQITAITAEHVYGRLPITDGRELTAQQVKWRAMLRRRLVQIDDPNARAGFQSRCEVIEKGVGLGDLVVHVHKDRRIERSRGQARIVGLAQRQPHVTQIEIFDPLAQLPKIVTSDVLGDDPTVRAQQWRQSDCVIAIAGADVADGHAGLELQKSNELTRLIQRIALLFG